MPRLTPDLVNKLQNYMASGMEFFGQPITLRKYISASAGNPELGIADKFCYQERPSLMELRTLSLEEMQVVGGSDLRGTMEYMSIAPIDLRDEVIYNNEVYRAVSLPEHETIGTTIYYKGLIQRASITGTWS